MYLIQIISISFLFVLQLIFGDISGNVANMICLVLILIFGIPHGAIDHKVHLSLKKSAKLGLFIARYLFIAFLYVLIWLISPEVGLITFLFTSAYHFGQETIENYYTSNKILINLVIGLFIVFGPLTFHYQEAKPFLDIIAPGFFPELSESMTKSIALVLLVSALIVSIYLKLSGKIDLPKLRGLLFFIAYVTIANLLFSFLIAFTVYFILFHSLNAFRHQFQWLSNQKEHYNFISFFKDLVGFSLLAIVGIAFLLWISDASNINQLVSYFFILTSIITLPHAITLDGFYKKRSKKLHFSSSNARIKTSSS